MRFIVFLFLILTPVLSFTITTHAQSSPPVAPITDDQATQNQTDRGFIPCSGVTCSACDLVALANTLIDWLIGILFVLFAILFAVAGVRLVTSGGNQSALQGAKSSLTNAVIGLIIVLAAWVLVDTIMRVLVGNGGQFSNNTPWSEIECWSQTDVDFNRYEIETIQEPPGANTVPTRTTNIGNVSFTRADNVSASPARTSAQARQALSNAGVLDGGNVISYMGMRQVAIDGVIQINNECQCDVTITEVTGGTHSTRGIFTHANGYKVDIRTRDNPELVSFVQDNFTFTGRWSTGEPVYQRVTSTGLQRCAFHSTHLDCQFIPGN
jgi:hypothetical protein